MPDPGPPAAQDTCGDGLDNDLDGFVDEDCGCSVGQTQPCFGLDRTSSTSARGSAHASSGISNVWRRAWP